MKAIVNSEVCVGGVNEVRIGEAELCPPLLWVVYNRGGGTIYLGSHFYNSERDPVLWDLDWDWLLVGEGSE